mgnify:CR=1 FL=1
MEEWFAFDKKSLFSCIKRWIKSLRSQEDIKHNQSQAIILKEIMEWKRKPEKLPTGEVGKKEHPFKKFIK